MRIGIDARLGLRSGVGRYTTEIVSGVSRMAPEFRFVVFAKPQDVDRLADLFQAQQNIEWVSVPGAPFQLREHLEMGRAIRRAELDLLHLTFDYAMPLWASAPILLTVHDAWFEAETFFRSEWTRRYFQTMTRRGLRRAGQVATVSQFVKDKILTYCPWMASKAERIHVIPNGVGAQFTPLGHPQSEPEETGVPQPYLLYVGVLARIKNTMGLFEAYAALRRSMPDAPRLVVAGKRDPSCPDPLPRLRELGLEAHVTLLGYVPDKALPDLYRKASLFVLPSFHEGFGIPVLEAMASGVPVVATNRGGVPEVAGGAACLVDPLRPDDIAGGIKTVLTDDRMRQGMVDAGLRRARQFSWTASARATLELYRESVGR